MFHKPDIAKLGDLDSLPSWIFDHLGEGSSYMTDKGNQSPASPMKGSSILETNPLVAIHPLVEEKNNAMSLEELNSLKDSHSFPLGVRIRLPEEGETITSARPGEPNSFPTLGEVSLALWHCGEYTNIPSPSPSSSTYSTLTVILNRIKAGCISRRGSPRKGAPRVLRTWDIPNKHCNNLPRLYGDEPKVFEEIFKSVEKLGRFSMLVLLDSKSFRRVFISPGSIASGSVGEDHPEGGAPSSSGDAAMSKGISLKKLDEKIKKLKNRSSSGTPTPAKRVVIGEKHAREGFASSSSKKGKADDGSKGKGVDREPEGKKATPSGHALVLDSSLAVRSREVGDHASLQEGQAASMESEANDELVKMKSDQDPLADKFERSGVLVVKLSEALDKAKESVVEEFKSSPEFLVAIEDSTSKYFGKGFEFCKVQLCRHHLDLAIDLEGTILDQELLAEQDEAKEEKEKEKEKVGEN
ncbi:hypothetical protein Acr_17g0004700 [Actinidia rufa]|uniref:Uncharacterized protein n=1 Tax=Actinidia rufa TaxID=165716 RepID=A0A7J0G2B6_9ERIC|nr:hypothetical protein Acr_17g0004700 [Actinidia rufa]